MDSARVAKRMGATKCTVLYRRDREKMPARKIEIEEVLQEKTEILCNTRLVDITVKEGQIDKVNCIKTKTVNDKIEDIENSEFTIKANSIIFAIGLKPDNSLLENEGIETQNGFIKLDENNMTNIEGVFAGGDVCKDKSTVCVSISEGKKAAEKIEKYCL